MSLPPERLVPVDGAELCVQTSGDPDPPTLVLVSGAAASLDWWPDELCERLVAGGRRVVRYDHRDTGRSFTDPPGHPSYDGGVLERDLVRLVEVLDLAPAHLVGVSMGGGIAQSVAVRRPDLVASLTAVATSPLGDHGPLPGPAPRVAASFADPPADPDWADPDAVTAWFLEAQRTFAGRLGVDEPTVRATVAAVLARSHDVAAAGNHWLVVGDEGDDAGPVDVRDVAVPTLVVHGSDDPLFPLAHGQALAAAVPGARLLVLDGMGHEVPPAVTWDVVVPALLDHTAR